MDKSFSIMTLNVHDFKNSEMEDSYDKILNTIKPFHVIALQEVYDKNYLHKITDGYNYTYNKGTVIMTKYPIKIVIEGPVEECYTSLIIQLPIHKPILVTNVHLDNQNEKNRKKELNSILEKISFLTNDYPSILLGDFNSLTKKDYTLKEWGEIYKIRKNGFWELPLTGLTDYLKLEWFDPGSKDKNKTCRYNTRIDYIYTKNINILKHDIIETLPNISDHNLVYIFFI